MSGSTLRRDFLKQSATVVAAGSIPSLARATPVHVANREVLRIGLVGCGGRGTGAAVNALMADPNTELVALGDTFADHLNDSLASLQHNADVASRVKVDADHRFVGFDAYRGVIDSCDVVLLCTATHFRPQHVEYGVEKGVHLFVEKPVGSDAPGVRRVHAAGKKSVANGKCVVTGLCYRYHRAKQETMKRIHDGAIGDFVTMQATYNAGNLWHRGRQPQWSEMEFQVRNWLYFTWLSGDHIAEQHIHSLDKLAWAMKDEYPVKAVSSGGRVQRVGAEFGNVYDHFNTVYEWKSGLKGFSSCRQWYGAATDVSDFVYGTKGTCAIQNHSIKGETKWRHRGVEGDPDDMYLNEHVALFRAIREGRVIDDTDIMCNSTMMAIMGRMAAYTGQEITWDQAWNSKEDLSPKQYAWGDAPICEVAMPGVTKFA